MDDTFKKIVSTQFFSHIKIMLYLNLYWLINKNSKKQ